MKPALVLSATAVVLVVILLLAAYETTPQPQVAYNISDGRSWPRSIVINPSSDLIYVDSVSGFYPPVGYSFEEINGSSGEIVNSVPFPGIPGEMAIDEASNVVYALGSSASSNSIFVYSGALGNFERNITVSAPAYNIAFDAALDRLFVSTQYGLIDINASSGTTISSVGLGSFSEGMAIDQNSQVVYVANYLSASISAVSATNLTLVKTIQLPNSSYPSGLALDTSTGLLYSTTDQNYIVVINTRTDDLHTIQIARSASNETFSIAFDQKNDILYVPTEPGRVIAEVDASSGNIVSTFELGYGAYEMSVDQANGNLYVTNYHEITSITPGSRGDSYYFVGGAAAVVIVSLAMVAFTTKKKYSP